MLYNKNDPNIFPSRDEFFNYWRVMNDENAFLDYEESIKSKDEYESFKDEVYLNFILNNF